MRDQKLPQAARVLLAAAALAAAGGTACRTSVDAGIESANDLLFHKQYVDAERLYRKLLKRLDSSAGLDERQEEQQLYVLDRLGKINAIYLHDYDQAVADYGLLVRRYPKSEQAFAARAMVADIYHHRLGNLQSAIDEYQRIVGQFPDRPETKRTLLKIAAAYQQLKNYEQARTEAEALLNSWPDSPEAIQARFQIANTYYIEGRYAEAIATYETLLQANLEPTMKALVLFELGNCFQELAESERALDYYYTCLADHPNPLLVQRKIRRLRTRLRRTRPAAGVQHGGQLRARLAKPGPATQPTKAAAETAPPPTLRLWPAAGTKAPVGRPADAPARLGPAAETAQPETPAPPAAGPAADTAAQATRAPAEAKKAARKPATQPAAAGDSGPAPGDASAETAPAATP